MVKLTRGLRFRRLHFITFWPRSRVAQCFIACFAVQLGCWLLPSVSTALEKEALKPSTNQQACTFTSGPIDQNCLVRSGSVEVKGTRTYSANGVTFPPDLKVFAIDLQKVAHRDTFRIVRRSSDVPSQSSGFELFQADTHFRMARSPQVGFSREIRLSDDKSGLIIPSDDFARLSAEPDLWIGAYWAADWAFETMPIKHQVRDQQKLMISPLVSKRAIRKSFPFFFFNAFTALAKPGDYVFDESAQVVYAAAVNDTDVFEVAVEDNLLEIKGARDLKISGLKLQKGLGTALVIKDSENVTIDGCEIKHMGRNAITVEGGKNVVISNCRIDDIAETAVELKGGDRTTLAPAGHAIVNSTITNFDLETRTYHPGVRLAGVGIRVEGNTIAHSPHSGIILQGNDHVIRGNRLEDLVTEADDAGAIYVGRDWTERGNVIENNWFRNIGMPAVPNSPLVTGRQYVSGIYLDDQESGYRIERNVFQNVSRPVFIHGGRDNTVKDNAFLQCDYAGIYLHRRGEGLSGGTLEQRLNAVPYSSPVWAERYPALATIRSEKPGEPINNKASGNIAVGCQPYALSAKTSPSLWPDIANGSTTFTANPLVKDPLEILRRAGRSCKEYPILCK